VPAFEITAPDGRKYRVEGPGTREEALAQVQAQYQQQSSPRPFVGPQQPAAHPAGSRVAQAAKDVAAGIPRTAGLAGRTLAEGAMNVVAPFADALGALANRPLKWAGSDFRFPEQHTAALSHHLTEAGLPKPETTAEKVSDVASQLMVGAYAGAPLTSAVMGKLGLNTASAAMPKPSRASTAPARTLEDAGVPLDASQRSGGRFMGMLRSAVANHPFTAGRTASFAGQQQKAFNRAVLRSIGENSADEATQPVMAAAYRRIGNVFNQIGKQGAQFDDALQAEIAGVMDDALRTVPQSVMGTLQRNVDDILGSIDDAGRINGEQFIKIRSHLSELADNADVGRVAERLEQAMLGALERTHPGQKQMLRDAADQWRSMRIIQTAIGKGAERDISPLRLANAIGSRQNQAMSVYGMGGDQRLVELSQAARTVLPQALPDSGTVPRGLMQAPLRAIATAPLYRGAQNYLFRQPSPPGSGVLRNALAAPTVGATNALIGQAR
jgi:hypothetical protein